MDPTQFEIIVSSLDQHVQIAMRNPLINRASQLQQKLTTTLRPVLIDHCNRDKDVRQAMTAWINRSILNLSISYKGDPEDLLAEGLEAAENLRDTMIEVVSSCLSTLVPTRVHGDASQFETPNSIQIRAWEEQARTITARARAGSLVLENTAPIVSQTVYNRDSLRRQNIPFTTYAGYTVLNGQVVLGIPEEYVQSQILKVLIENKKATPDSDPFITNAQREEVFQVTINRFLERSKGIGYELVADPIQWQKTRWYWMQDSSLIQKLSTARMGASKPQKDLSRRTKLWSTSHAKPDETPAQRLRREERERKKRYENVQYQTTWGFAFAKF